MAFLWYTPSQGPCCTIEIHGWHSRFMIEQLSYMCISWNKWGVGHNMAVIYYGWSLLPVCNIYPAKIDKITTDIIWLLCWLVSRTFVWPKCKIKHFKLWAGNIWVNQGQGGNNAHEFNSGQIIDIMIHHGFLLLSFLKERHLCALILEPIDSVRFRSSFKLRDTNITPKCTWKPYLSQYSLTVHLNMKNHNEIHGFICDTTNAATSSLR